MGILSKAKKIIENDILNHQYEMDKTENVILFNPAISSLNRGDDIIVQSCKKHLNSIGVIKDDFLIELSSHLPIINWYLRLIGKPKYTFVLGSNLLDGAMNKRVKQWHITKMNLPYLNNIVLMGVGWRTYNNIPNAYTSKMYKRLFNNGFFHSVRDEFTKNMLNSIGIVNVINTGCPTMWCLTKEHCAKIPQKKAETVIFTLTDYAQNTERDTKLLNCLRKKYKFLYFWIQGAGDLKYLNSLELPYYEEIRLVNSSLDEYEAFLRKTDCDYVGTRLHGGIKAMHHYRRTIIIGIDNRALELQRDYNINVLNQKNIDELDTMIDSNIKTNITINKENIALWLSQFNSNKNIMAKKSK